jgi:ActR/RegA family two-component response regulator
MDIPINPSHLNAKRGKILFAEDDELFRVSLAELLQRAGFEFDCATSAPEVIEKLKTGDYEALLSDINMPGNHGLGLVESVSSLAENLPIILLTGSPTVETATRSVRLRVFAYLVKPPDFDEVCQVLTSAISEYRNLRILRDNRARLQDWEKEIERILRLLQHPASPNRQAPMQSYLRLTLRNLVVSLVELEHLLLQNGDSLGTDPLLEKQDLTQAVRKTIAVLQKTRDHFKSRDLAELRKELETIVR